MKKLVVLDISPTLTMYEETDMDFALGYWWWFFLVQPAPFPETLISASPAAYLAKKITSGLAGSVPFTDETYAAYLRYMRDPATVHSMCEDYRAAASIDLVHDRADRELGKKITCPVHVLWGEHGVVHRRFAPLQDWRKFATTVSGRSVPAGHYIAEEIPDLLLCELTAFFG
ncbi:MAG: alpha/beta hydrolase [Aeromicrobium sp.]|nr:alpha/beta hydrolase [Burkholderiales bacterium]